MKDKKNKKSKLKSTLNWFFIVSLITFVLSLIFSFISTLALTKLSIIPATLILLLVILIGIFFDIIAVAVTIAEEHNFHAKASKKINGAKTSINLIRNSHKVSNFCADVIGDIAGVLSGAISAILTIKITEFFGLDFNLQFFISAVVASLTVGGKAIGKSVAKEYSDKIVDKVSNLLTFFNLNN